PPTAGCVSQKADFRCLMRWWRTWPRDASRPRRERFRCRADHLTTRRRHPQNRKAALVGALRAETKNAVDARIARRIGKHLLAEPLGSLCFDERCHQRYRIIGKRRGADRVLAVARAVPCREITEPCLLRRGVPAA